MSGESKREHKKKHSHLQSVSGSISNEEKLQKKKSACVIEPNLQSVQHVASKKTVSNGKAESAKRLVYDRSPRSDSNGLKNYLLYSVYENNYHITGTKGGNFKELAKQFGNDKVQGLEKVSADSLQKKYEDIIEDVRSSIENGYLSDMNGEASEEECESSSDSEQGHTKKRRFNHSEPFERVAKLIISEVENMEELKMINKKERDVRDNNLGAAETQVFDLIDDAANTHGNGSSSSAAVKLKAGAPRKSVHDVQIEEFKTAMMTAAATPAPAPASVPATASVTAQSNSLGVQRDTAEEVNRITMVLSKKFVMTVEDVLEEADISKSGKEAFYTATGMRGDKPAKKLVLFMLDLAQDKNKTLVRHVMDTCGLNASDSVDIVDLLNTAAE